MYVNIFYFIYSELKLWFFTVKSAVIFEFGPQLVLLLANFAFLFLSLCKIRQQPGSNLEESSTSNTTNKNKYEWLINTIQIVFKQFQNPLDSTRISNFLR